MSLRWEPRTAAVCGVLAAVAACAAVLVVGSGEFPIAPPDVVRVLLGRGDQATEFIVTTLRLPRAVTGLLAGLALGLSGAIFQSISRNPSAAPTSSASRPGRRRARCCRSWCSAAARSRSPPVRSRARC
ncbi:iron chelate uptake ABC transporter family permease subunit [Actinomadura luteofluorescens]|uniref:iron chelate uptake ABC transporter family permease subunit n=1 Tax=Actinomadura luteofluorescens TaxID=46163 RepID=UPI003645BEFE